MKNAPKILLFVVWLILIGMAFYFIQQTGIPASELPEKIKEFVASFGIWGPLVYILLYAVRTLTFFSATVFTVASGLIFGPWLGIFYTIIAGNVSALVAFFVGRYFGGDVIAKAGDKIAFFPKSEKFHENGFMTVLLMRLLFFPFDWVGYLSGAYKIRVRDFFLGSLIGTLPGLIAFVAIGDVFDNPLQSLAIFLPFFIIGIIIAKFLKKTTLGRELDSIKTHGEQ